MKKQNLSNQKNKSNLLKKEKANKLIHQTGSIFSYEEQKNILNLTAQLPHSFTLEKNSINLYPSKF